MDYVPEESAINTLAIEVGELCSAVAMGFVACGPPAYHQTWPYEAVKCRP